MEAEFENVTDKPILTHGHSLLINKDHDDQMEICGYRPNKLKTIITYVFIILTGGLLRLIFHWVPHWYLRARCVPCIITEAKYILITELYNETHKIFYVKPLHTLTLDGIQKRKNAEKVEDKDEMIENNITAFSVHFENGIFREVDSLLTFSCKKVTYIWNVESHEFIKLRGLDHGVCSDTIHKNRGLSKNEQYMRRVVYGKNEIVVKEQTVGTLLFLEVLNPFNIFQVFSFILWFADNYYYYAAAILLMSVFGISMTVIQTRRNQRNLKSTVHSSDVATVLRRDESELKSFNESLTEAISTELLVPGDILEIPPHGCIMQCDALLLTGNCILNESMLTGESVPVTKTPFPNLSDVYYDPKEHARHTLFCGTQVIQTRYFGNEKVLAVVIRTGFSTAKGGLVRSILYPPPVDFRFEKDSYRFVALLGGIASMGFVYTIVTKVMRGVHARDLILEALDLITIVVPPALPAAMTVGRLYAQTRLQKNQIFCISPRSINVSGSIDCVCFDKTGTLTEDGLDLLCVVPITDKSFNGPVRDVESLPYNTFVYGLVSCHSLTIIDKQITGDPLDLKMFESTKWSIEDPEISDNTKFNMIYPTVLTPPKNRSNHDLSPEIELQIGIIREFPFSSSSQRMGVIIRKLGANNFEYYSKGSPEMILNFVTQSSIPDNFSQILESYTQEGYRVIALAHKQLKLTYAKAQKVQREAIEHDMTLLGLIVLENRLKEKTTPCIQKLNNAHIRVIMVTGDNILTAVSVAKDCGIITAGQSVISVNADNSTPPRLYYTLTATKNMNNDASVLSNSASIVSLDTVESQTMTNHCVRPQSLFNNYRFAMTGKVWGIVKNDHPDLIPRLVTRGSIFARMSPEQKQQLVQDLQGIGYYVAMCGDGANDCGALKAAHTGISLSEAESSVASPFTSKNPNINCVLDIIKEGRAALVTSFGIFKYMASYSMCQFISVMILYSLESNLTDIEFLYIDLFIISVFAFFFGRTEAYKGKLVKETPLNSLISFSPILSLLLQLILVVFFQAAAFFHLKSQSWYVPFDSAGKTDKDAVGCVENYTIFTISGFQYIILAIVFSKGKPYRESIFSNYGFIFSAIAMAVVSVYLALEPLEFLQEQFELVLPKSFEFRLYLIAYAGVNFVLSILIEVLIVEHCVFKKLRFKFHNVYKSKRKFLAIEKDLSSDPKWPMLTSNYHSAASPLTPLPSCTAEITVESEKFDKNHVLNSFYQGGNYTRLDSIEPMTPTFKIDIKNEKFQYSAPNSTKSTPTYNPNKNLAPKSNHKSLENGIDDAQSMEHFDSCDFKSALSSDASFQTATSVPNTPLKIAIRSNSVQPKSKPVLNITTKRIRSLSSNYEENSKPILANGTCNSEFNLCSNGDVFGLHDYRQPQFCYKIDPNNAINNIAEVFENDYLRTLVDEGNHNGPKHVNADFAQFEPIMNEFDSIIGQYDDNNMVQDGNEHKNDQRNIVMKSEDSVIDFNRKVAKINQAPINGVEDLKFKNTTPDVILGLENDVLKCRNNSEISKSNDLGLITLGFKNVDASTVDAETNMWGPTNMTLGGDVAKLMNGTAVHDQFFDQLGDKNKKPNLELNGIDSR